jgi:drug/metabolite transporter superfamily protein YnfA
VGIEDQMMTKARFNLISALCSMLGGFILIVVLHSGSGFFWMIASIIWLVLALLRRGDAERLEHADRRIARRLSRLLLFS